MTITRADIEVMYAWGIRLSDWSRLPEHKRVEYRTNVAQVMPTDTSFAAHAEGYC